LNRFLKSEEGVSVIFGTLLLILITIIAASSVAFMISSIQKDTMERESHQAIVENEELQIVSIEPHGDGSNWTSMDITILNMNIADSYLSSIRTNDGYFLNFKAYDDSGNYDVYNDYPAVYNAGNKLKIPATKSKKLHLNVSDIAVQGNESIDTSGWLNNSLDFTYQLDNHPWKAYYGYDFTYALTNVSNTTILLDSSNFSIDNENQQITFFGNDSGGSLSNTTNYNISYELDFQSYAGQPLREKDALKVELISSYINVFKDLFTPPMPLAEVQFRSEEVYINGSLIPRTYVILDASDSIDTDGFITDYKWTVQADNQYLYNSNLSGMVVRAEKIDVSNHNNVTIDLHLTDDTGMTSSLSQVSGLIRIL